MEKKKLIFIILCLTLSPIFSFSVCFSQDLTPLTDNELSLVFAKAAASASAVDIYVDSDNRAVSRTLDLASSIISGNSGKTVKIMVEDLTIETLTGGFSWKDTDGVDGNSGGVFTIFSHIPDILHVDMAAPVAIEPKVGSIPGFTDDEVVYLEVRIPGMEVGVEKITKVLAMTNRMVTDTPYRYYESGDIDPYSGRVLSSANDPNHLLDNPNTAELDPARKYAEKNEIMAVYYGTSSKTTICGAFLPNGQPDITKPGRVYVYTH